MSHAERTARIVLGLLPVPLTLAFQLAFWSRIRPFALFLFVQAVYISSWIGGIYTGILSTFGAAAFVYYYFVPPERSWGDPDEPKHIIVLGLFVVLGLVICTFHERFKQANRALSAALAGGRRSNELLRRAKDEVSSLYVKTKELDALKTRLFAGVSHELRTPLTLVLDPAERLAARPEVDAAVRDAAALIARNARTLLRYVDDLLEITQMINDLLDVTRLDSRQLAIAPTAVDVAVVAREVSDRMFADEPHVEIRGPHAHGLGGLRARGAGHRQPALERG